LSKGLSASALLGVLGVFGLLSGEVETGAGVGGTGSRADLGRGFDKWNALVLDSEDMAALIFLWVEANRPPGVGGRARRSVEAFEAAESVLLGVNGTERVGLSAADNFDEELGMAVRKEERSKVNREKDAVIT
jgi:hypothetical protein